MTTARFARSGRLRLCILLGMFIGLILMIFVYHMSQNQLDETRAFQVRCEKNQEGLNEQLQSLTEQKFAAEKNLDMMRNEKISMQQNYDARLSESEHKHGEKERELAEKYEAQLTKLKLLEKKHADLEADCVKSKKQHLEDTNAFEQKLQSLLAELQKDKSAKEQEVAAWKEKYDVLLRDSERKTHSLEATIVDFKAHCDYVPKVQPAEAPAEQQQLNRPASRTPETTHNSSPSQLVHSIEKPRNSKSFNEQVQVSDGFYRIGGGVNLIRINKTATNATTTSTNNIKPQSRKEQEQLQLFPFSATRNNHSLILNSVENFQIVPKSLKTAGNDADAELKQQEQPVLAISASPLSAPRKPSSTASSVGGAAGAGAGAIPEAGDASIAPKLSSSSGMPPLAMPPPKPAERKLPENVAPIPENFEDKAESNKLDPADVDTAAEELPKNEIGNDNKNNRYANAVNDLEQGKALGVAPKPNEDSGAHEVKDFMNEQNFNLPAAAAENHFFDGDAAAPAAGNNDEGVKDAAANNKQPAQANEAGEDDDDIADVAVKQPQHLLDAENLNNEIAGDQGKEFPEGLHLDDGIEEDQDEDDYSFPQRKQGAEAIRH
ncbi:uncharacterized protein LOC115623775 isoform X1 [Scaptodrosophila lebanonensis]|uniref:Uncharacterized protein LOC115623775 isoform X1 n=1 Tax=Drosophila lebanonensis TaxID=7225 RepID=A0A6J2TGM6_DROLE|nr:uncharacterized protein LOC115623775 isoform X1 [Scaptodrosophila lebanonensis]